MDGMDSDVQKNLVMQLEDSYKKIDSLTYYNSISRLPNRRKLVDLFNQHVKQEKDLERVIFSIDIDRFHTVNELYGREVGDQLLAEIGERLKNIFCQDFCVYHDGVDEFYVYLKDIPYTELENKGQELLDILTPPFHLENNIFYITASIGISHYPTVGKTIDDLLAQAEIAMLKVKNITRNSFQIFKPSDATEMVRKKRIEFEMQKALDNEELNLVYQPKVLLD